MANFYTNISAMEPMMPQEGLSDLEDLTVDLIAKAKGLENKIHPVVQKSVGDLVRSMNCYYSNLIEGHHTHPRDIEKALNSEFSNDLEKRNLQLEAKAHIELQKIIDDQKIEKISSKEFIQFIHKEFCKRLPDELLTVNHPDTGKKIKVKPGVLRDGNVQVGKHIAPSYKALDKFLERFETAYKKEELSKIQQILALGSSHHRLLWIHPFYDGNGRTVRMFSHAYLKSIGVGSSLWSISRGLSRNVTQYKTLLMAADEPRQGDLDGRGNLSQKALNDFVKFFLETCIDQIDYMSELLDMQNLLRRMELYATEQIAFGNLPKGSFALLREALLAGEFERGRAPEITAYKDRQARTVLSALTTKGLLISDSPRGAVRLGFPNDVVERYFPKLYPL